MDTLKFVDLFAGIGGMRLGFERAAQSLGFSTECVLSCDIDPDARLVYKLNFEEEPLGDIRTIDELPEHDVLLAGFPCQPFSYAGKKNGFGDTRGTLFFEITRLVDSTQPKILVLENVRGLLSHDGGRTFNTIKHEIVKRGYSFDAFLLNSVNYGLPQNRVRLYMVAVFGGYEGVLRLTSDRGPRDTHAYLPSLFGDCPKLSDILEDNPDPKYDCSPEFVQRLKNFFGGDLNRLHGIRLIDYRGGNSVHSWELGLRGECTPEEIELMNRLILERRKAKFGRHQDGKLLSEEQIASFFPHPNLKQILSSLVAKKYLKVVDGKYKPTAGNMSFEVYKFLDPRKISLTLVASDTNRLGVYYKGRVRKLTPREAARLQGFPDTFILHPEDTEAYFQLGNAVSVNVVEAVAKEVIRVVYCVGTKRISAESKVKVDPLEAGASGDEVNGLFQVQT